LIGCLPPGRDKTGIHRLHVISDRSKSGVRCVDFLQKLVGSIPTPSYPSLPYPPSSFPPISLPYPSIPNPLSLTPIQLRGRGKRFKLSQWGLGRSPDRQHICVYLRLWNAAGDDDFRCAEV